MKKKISIALASLCLISGALAGCKDNDGDKQKTVSGVQLKGMFSAYVPDETIDWSKVSVVVTYSDKSTETILASEIEFDVETPVNATTKAIISTEGLYGAESATEKDYAMSIKLVGVESSFNAGTISIDSITPEKYTLQSFTKPEFISIYEGTIENAGKTEAENASVLESYFKSGEEIFTVGTMNTFRFIPSASFRKNGVSITSGGLKLSNSYKKTVTVEEFVDSAYQTASAEDYDVVREGIKFAESAVGKKFRLTVQPEEFPVTNPASMEFKVEKGINVYTAKELGVLNLTSFTPSQNLGAVYYENAYGFDGQGAAQDNDTNAIFYDEATNSYGRKDTFGMWEKFLEDTGTFTKSEIAAYKDAPAYFLMNNITIQPEDIPSEFFITSKETQKFAGSLRDGALIYDIIPNVEKVINGNYFNINSSNIPLCMSTSSGSGFKILSETDATVDPGHAILFYVPGQKIRNGDDNKAYLTGNEYQSGTKHVLFKNINTIGNTGTELGHNKIEGDENFNKMAKLTGLVAFKSGMAPVTVENSIIKQYMIGVMANSNLAKYNGEAAAQLKDSRVYDCANAGAFNYECQNFRISNSELKRFGGAAVFNACSANNACYGAYTTLAQDCVVENYVTGEEVYFTAVGAAGQIAEIKAFNSIYSTKPFIHKVENVEYINVVSLSMEEGYMDSSDHVYYGGTIMENGTDYISKIDLRDPTNPAAQIVGGVHGMLSTYVPVATLDGTLTFNGQTVPGSMAAAVAFPSDVDLPVVGSVPAGMYVPQIGATGLEGLLPVTEYSGNYLHISLPINGSGDGPTLNMILGL